MKHYEIRNYYTNELIKRFNKEDEALEFMRQIKKEHPEIIYVMYITNY